MCMDSKYNKVVCDIAKLYYPKIQLTKCELRERQLAMVKDVCLIASKSINLVYPHKLRIVITSAVDPQALQQSFLQTHSFFTRSTLTTCGLVRSCARVEVGAGHTDSYEETQSDSSLWECDRRRDRTDSGEEGDAESAATAVRPCRHHYNICSVENTELHDNTKADRIVYISVHLPAKKFHEALSCSTSKQSNATETRKNSSHCDASTSAEDANQNPPDSVVMSLPYIEGSSPERPFLRPPNTTAKELMEIHRNYRRGLNQEWPVFIPPNMDEDLQNLEHPDPSKRPRYLPLAPPYHLLPNTSFFRKASIKPPPTYSSYGLHPLRRIINRYLASILVDQMKLEEELKMVTGEVKKTTQVEEKREHIAGKIENGNLEAEGVTCGTFESDARWRQPRHPRLVVNHLHYGGQLIHYIQNGGENPPPVPGYFASVPLIPGNVNVTRDLCGSVLSEYVQQRTMQGFKNIPLNTSTEESYSKMGTPLETLYHITHSEQILPISESEGEHISFQEHFPSCSLVTEKYGNVPLSESSISMNIAERCVSLCRSPYG
ncbi:unnamed protein product [Cylicocyclus nassatus]|uniref:Uncharacterized protein n=1 Tax=Cylicocyclus nassatus TaxID=53992 RepID=A0AA36DPC2_CYLNA|nr:unnamed protein product [Cylicocyclus nassatus]